MSKHQFITGGENILIVYDDLLMASTWMGNPHSGLGWKVENDILEGSSSKPLLLPRKSRNQ